MFYVSCFVEAAAIGEIQNFYIDKSYDLYSREETEAELIEISSSLYFYIDKSWWNSLPSKRQDEVEDALDDLTNEFEINIYPTLTSNYGPEWKPGIDNDEKITVLIHPLRDTARGYFNSGDGYIKYQNPESNEREMVYLDARHITDEIIKSLFAHEFVHLITFNQKDRKQSIEEEVWLNEARAEYAPTLCGYDSEYQGSYLKERVNQFLKTPSDSLTEWQGKAKDYGALNLFTQYLIDHYGKKILIDSLRSSKTGIESINYALEKNGFKEDFSQIFTDWTIAILVNDCSLGEKYCYKNENLKNLKVISTSNFLPSGFQSTLSVNSKTKPWAGNWYKISGGGGTLIFQFDGHFNGNFKVPYLLCEKSANCSIDFLDLDENQNGKIILEGFNTKYSSLTIIPSVQNISDLSSNFLFSWEAKLKIDNQGNGDKELIKKLLDKIAELKAEIARLKAQIAAILGQPAYCQQLDNNLYFGLRNNQEVRCLQEFLKNQGPEIYPEGLITGNFLSLTKAAVTRFQEKYIQEILNPLGLDKGTGFFGPLTRQVVNKLIHK